MKGISIRLMAALLATAGIVPSGASAADKALYKWVDSSGKVHFSDRPPTASEKVKSEAKLNLRSGSEKAESTAFSEVEPETPESNANQDEEKPSELALKKEAERREKECSDATAAVAQLQSGNKIFTLDNKTGERKYLDEKQIMERLKSAKDVADKLCKKE